MKVFVNFQLTSGFLILKIIYHKIVLCSKKFNVLFLIYLTSELLFQVDKFETEKNALTRDVADLTTRLVEARLSINDLEEQNVRKNNFITLTKRFGIHF